MDKEERVRNNDNKGKCRGCGRDIVWITTKKGKHVPCDPALLPVYEGGKEILFTEDGGTVKGTTNQKEGGSLLGYGYVSHWATCPEADGFRRR